MDDLESKLNSVLNDPKAMEQIMAFAQNFNGGQSPAPDAPAFSFDPAMLQKLGGLTQQCSIDKNQQSLLCALGPYLSRQRIQKLEKAMRAAKMASMAGILTGR